MFFSTDDDDDGFAPSSSSNLANLFGSDKDITKQSSLMYTAPKQPKRLSAAPSGDLKSDSKVAAGSTVVIYAGVVHAYKFEDSQPIRQGKLGAAVIGNHELCIYSLLLYHGKQQKVASATISVKFTYTVQDNNYATFYDDQRQIWSINFDSEQNATEFSKQVALAKANSARQSLNFVISQDLCLGHGPGFENGDTVLVKFTGRILSNYAIGNVFDSNESGDEYLKIKIGDGNLIKGFESGITGMKSNGERIFIIPPSWTHGAQGKDSNIPANTPLVFVVRIKRGDSISSRSSTPIMAEYDGKKSMRPTIPTKSSLPSPGEDISVKARSASIKEQLHLSSKSDKAGIISRMAKMGQQMLPLQGAVPVQPTSSESETEEEQRSISISQSSSSPEHLPKPLPRSQAHLKLPPSTVHSSMCHDMGGSPPVSTSGFTHSLGGITSSQALSIFQPSQSLAYPISSQTHVMPSGNPYVVLPAQSHVSPVTGIESHIPVLLTELRTQNTELRLNVTQVADKVDKVLGKLEQSSVYPTMEAGMLANNIQRIVHENESLKIDVKDKNQKIVMLTEKITDLLQRNQKFLEQSNTMLEQRSDFLQSASVQAQAKLSSLEQEKVHLQVELGEAKNKILELQTRLETSLVKEQELESQANVIEKMKSENGSLLSKCQSTEMSLNAVKQELALTIDKLWSEQQENVNLKKKLQALESDCERLKKKSVSIDEKNDLIMWQNKCDQLQKQSEDLQEQLAELRDTQKKPLEKVDSNMTPGQNKNLIEEVKKVMNATYRSLQRQFQLEENYTGQQIKGILASTIRCITLELLDYFAAAAEVVQRLPDSTAVGDSKMDSDKESESDVTVSPGNAPSQEAFSDFNQSEENERTTVLKNEEEKAKPVETETDKNGFTASTDNDNKLGAWKPQPPPLFDVEDNSDTEDDWLK